MQPAQGDTFGRYRLEAHVGAGGMGEVFRAYDATLRRRVAIKVLRAPRSPDRDGRVERVLREARAAAALDHPGVVAVFDVGEAHGHPFIVMEFVVGRSLRALIGVREAPIDERLRWLGDIARSLAAAHRAGLVHRDIKPENVMIREDGAVKLLDFGIARQLVDPDAPAGSGPASAAPESTMLGTPAYMAPEQIQRLPVDARADQFGWGVLAHELLTGALPWRGPAEGVPVAVAVVTEQAARVPATPGLPAHVAAVIERALAKSPAQRFASMDALVQALVGGAPRWLGPPTPPSTPAADTTPNTRAATAGPDEVPRRRAPRLVGLVALVSLVGLVGVALVSTLLVAPAPAPAPAPTWTPDEPARAAYDEGMRRVARAALNAGSEQMEIAIEYEPEFAAAHLRLALIGLIDGPYPAPSEPYHAAARLRRHLGERDQALLDALAPAFEREAPQLDEMIDRLDALTRRFPDDAELRLYLPLALSLRGRDDEAAAKFRSSLAHDPGSATAWLGLAYIHGGRDELSTARDALARCRALAPDAVDCLWYRLKLDAFTGRCEDMEAGAVAWQRLKTNDHGAVITHVHALIARDRPAAEIDAAEAEGARTISVALHTIAGQFTDSARQILAGEFLAADEILGDLPGEPGFSTYDRLGLGELRVALHEEMGDLPGAAAIARELRLRKGILPNVGFILDDGILADPTPIFDRVLLAAGEITPPELAARRDAWLESWRVRGGRHHEVELWLRARAGPTRTAADAREALAALPPGALVRRFIVDRLLVVDVARVHLLAGDPAAAIPLLRTATRSCLAALEPVRFVQAHALLGAALEATGDVAAACAAYAYVHMRWSAARPRSRTAADVDARRAALRCPAPA